MWRMTYDEFAQAIASLAMQLGAEWDGPTWRAYYRSLMRDPQPSRTLVLAAIDRAGATRTKFPSAAQLRELAESERADILAANPYRKCEACNYTGFIEAPDDHGVKRASRCTCWLAYQQQIAALNIGPALTDAPKQLEAGEAFDPRMAAAEGR